DSTLRKRTRPARRLAGRSRSATPAPRGERVGGSFCRGRTHQGARRGWPGAIVVRGAPDPPPGARTRPPSRRGDGYTSRVARPEALLTWTVPSPEVGKDWTRRLGGV